MTKYEIGVWEEQGGYLTIEAETEEEAEKIAEGFIADYGFEMDREPNAYPQVEGLKITHRNTHLV